MQDITAIDKEAYSTILAPADQLTGDATA